MDDGGSLRQMMAGFPRDTSPVSETSGCGPFFLPLVIDKTDGLVCVHEQPQNLAFLQYISACWAAVLRSRRGICPSGPESLKALSTPGKTNNWSCHIPIVCSCRAWQAI